MKIWLFIFSILAFSGVAYSESQTENKTIRIVADVWCPYNCDEESDKPGYIVELAKEFLEPLGYKVDYDVVPWKRALAGVKAGRYNAAIGASKIEAPKFVLPEETAGDNVNSFFVRKGFEWECKEHKESLEKVTLALIQGYDYSDVITEYLKENSSNTERIQFASDEEGLEINFQKLLRGRVDAIIENRNVMENFLNSKNAQNKIVSCGDLSTDKLSREIYLAFSPSILESKKLAKAFSDGLVEYRKSGKLEVLLKKYGIQDWK